MIPTILRKMTPTSFYFTSFRSLIVTCPFISFPSHPHFKGSVTNFIIEHFVMIPNLSEILGKYSPMLILPRNQRFSKYLLQLSIDEYLNVRMFQGKKLAGGGAF